MKIKLFIAATFLLGSSALFFNSCNSYSSKSNMELIKELNENENKCNEAIREGNSGDMKKYGEVCDKIMEELQKRDLNDEEKDAFWNRKYLFY